MSGNHPHHPPHAEIEGAWYLISASTMERRRVLATEAAQRIMRDVLKQLVIRLGIDLKAWVILDDHYHLLLKREGNCSISPFVAQLHGASSRQINALDATLGRRIWDNYWDTCIRGEPDFWRRFNYVHHNPVKHGYVRDMGDWEFSSYRYYLNARGREWMDDCWMQYPVTDWSNGIE